MYRITFIHPNSAAQVDDRRNELIELTTAFTVSVVPSPIKFSHIEALLVTLSASKPASTLKSTVHNPQKLFPSYGLPVSPDLRPGCDDRRNKRRSSSIVLGAGPTRPSPKTAFHDPSVSRANKLARSPALQIRPLVWLLLA